MPKPSRIRTAPFSVVAIMVLGAISACSPIGGSCIGGSGVCWGTGTCSGQGSCNGPATCEGSGSCDGFGTCVTKEGEGICHGKGKCNAKSPVHRPYPVKKKPYQGRANQP